jgi:hypothetical protein
MTRPIERPVGHMTRRDTAEWRPGAFALRTGPNISAHGQRC